MICFIGCTGREKDKKEQSVQPGSQEASVKVAAYIIRI